MKKQYASKEKVLCQFCPKSFRKDVLHAHCKRMHPEQVKKDSPSITALFAPRDKEVSLPSDTVEELESVPSTNLPNTADSSQPTPEDSTASKRPRTETRQAKRSTPGGIAPSFALQLVAMMTLLNSMNLAQQQLEVSVGNLPDLVAQAVVAQLHPPTSSATSSVTQDVRQCRTRDELIEKLGLKKYEDDGIIACSFCFKHSLNAPSKICIGHNKEAAGKFSSTSLLKNLKPRIISHFKSAIHEWCVERENHERLEIKRTNDVGLTIARLAFETIVEARSYKSFERAILRQHLIGTRVGTLNHGRDFVRNFLRSLYHVCKERVIKFFNSVDPSTEHPILFAVNADKVTEFRRTGQLIGALAIDLGEIKAIFLDDPVVLEGHDAKGIYANIMNSLVDRFRFSLRQLRTQLTGMAFDGQYFGLDVPRALCERIGTSVEWTMPGWDGGHRTELVLGDVRKDEVLTWYKEIPEAINEIHSKVAYGKNYEALRKCAVKVGQKFYNIQTFCDTRFAQAERKVYKNFILNYLASVTHFQEKVQNGKDEERAYATKFLAEMYKLVFVVTVLGLADLLRKVKEVSLFQQTVNTLPWEVTEKEAQFAHNFDEVYTKQLDFQDRDSSKEPLNPTDFPMLCAHQAEIETKGTFFGVNLKTAPAHGRNFKKAFRSVCTSRLAKWCDLILEHFTSRFLDGEVHAWCAVMAGCFDLRFLFQLPCKLSDEKGCLRKVYLWAKEHGNVSLPTFAVMWAQHEVIKQRLVTAYRAHAKYAQWYLASGTVVMKDLLTNPEFYSDVHDWVFLFQHCALKTQNEAVVESQGSCVDKHAAGQRHLTQEALVMETFVHWNGPAAQHSDALLKDALDHHFNGKKWHFTATDSRAKVHKVSEVVDRLMSQDSKFSFM